MQCKCFVSDTEMQKTVRRTSKRYVFAYVATSQNLYFIFFSREFKPLRCTSTFALQSLVSSSLDISSALWLKTHGLVARRLTIMDALAPTAVPHGTKYIPVLDKHVLSKVFDEVKLLCYFKAKINPGTAFKRIFFSFLLTSIRFIIALSSAPHKWPKWTKCLV